MGCMGLIAVGTLTDASFEGLLERVTTIVIPSPVKAARRATSTMEF
jgi:hypothetical protein